MIPLRLPAIRFERWYRREIAVADDAG